MKYKRPRAGFTLVELLVAIGIIAVLMSILLPALGRARDAAFSIQCAANLRSVGQGLAAYEAENEQYLPSSYEYRGSSIDPATGVQSPDKPLSGYVHWSSLVYGGSGNIPPAAFVCPAMRGGGLPAADPPQPGYGNFEPNQTTEADDSGSPDPEGRVQPVTGADGTGAVKKWLPDAQAPRMAYTLNEALCGRNKHVPGFQGSARFYRPVRVSQVDNPSGTILATEFVDEWGIVAGLYDGAGGGGASKSHRPVSPFRAAGNGAGDTATGGVCDPSNVAAGTLLRKTNATDFFRCDAASTTTYNGPNGPQSFDPIADYQAGNYSAASRATRLDWVGRNHGRGEKYADNKSNFLYLDGHVETKSVRETVPKDASTALPWEWGRLPYSLSENNVQTP